MQFPSRLAKKSVVEFDVDESSDSGLTGKAPSDDSVGVLAPEDPKHDAYLPDGTGLVAGPAVAAPAGSADDVAIGPAAGTQFVPEIRPTGAWRRVNLPDGFGQIIWDARGGSTINAHCSCEAHVYLRMLCLASQL